MCLLHNASHRNNIGSSNKISSKSDQVLNIRVSSLGDEALFKVGVQSVDIKSPQVFEGSGDIVREFAYEWQEHDTPLFHVVFDVFSASANRNDVTTAIVLWSTIRSAISAISCCVIAIFIFAQLIIFSVFVTKQAWSIALQIKVTWLLVRSTSNITFTKVTSLVNVQK